ncbi:MAG: DUF1592 domain-containing protein, partial [Planctomycetota bacterium]
QTGQGQSTPTFGQNDATQLRAVVGNYCLDCHAGDDAEAGLAFEVVLKQTLGEQGPLEDGAALATLDTWTAVANALASGHMPPGEAEQPAESERRAAVEAVERLTRTLVCRGEPDPGRVTIRRLSRHEYRYTILDLVGIDYEVDDDFPTDDIGYGFDNIGDVLSMPPLLLEKYLNAAERILDEAIVTETTIEPRMQYFAPEDLLRTPVMQAEPGWLTEEGELFVFFDVARAGKYAVRVWAWGQQAGPDVTRMEITIDQQSHGEYGVRTKRNNAQKSEVVVELTAGRHRVAAEYLNDYWSPEADRRGDRNLHISAIEVVGPLDAGEVDLPESHRQIFFVSPGEFLSVAEPTGAQQKEKRRNADVAQQAAARKIAQRRAAEEILARFATRAFRRPLEIGERVRLLSLYDKATADGDNHETAVQVALSAVLVSPQFLFRIERDPPRARPGEVYRIDNHELASRLSYFLWSSLPDEALRERAAKGDLHEPEVLRAEVRRMLRSPKARRLVDNFAGQWLQLRRLDEVAPDTEQFSFDEELRSAMYGEATALFESVMREDKSVIDLIDADYTFVNERLARHYGWDDVDGEALRQVDLTDGNRGGVLMTAAVLTLTSNPSRTSPVKRGKWILEQLLGVTSEPPADVPALDEAADNRAAGKSLSLRERLARHTADASCASCHLRMDPLGFSLENYDAVGRWRQDERGRPIDASAELPDGTQFEGPGGLKRILLERKQEFVECLTEAMLTFALGRGLEPYDACAVDAIVAQAAAEGYRFSALVDGIVQSYPFQYRRRATADERPLQEEESTEESHE